MMTARFAHARSRIDRAPAAVTFLVVLVPLLFVYSLSHEREHQNVDAIAAALPAWSLVAEGDVAVDEFSRLPVPWWVSVDDRTVSNRPPGIIFTAVPFYFLAGDRDLDGPLPSMTPAAFAGSVTAALAMAILHLVFRRLVSPSAAVAAALIAGLGTSTWTISSDQLWPHGPVQMWLALGVFAAARAGHLRSGLAYAVAVFTRPVTAIAAAAAGIAHSLLTRTWKPLVAFGAGSALGVIGLVAYNQAVFGTLSPVTSSYGGQVLETAAGQGVIWYVGNVAAALASPFYSFLLWSPVILILLPGLGKAWRAAPDWARSSAVAAIVYFAVHLWLNRQSGGLAYNYRYPLEMLTLAAPMLVLSYREWLSVSGERLRRYFPVAVVFSVGIQAAEAWITHQSLFLS